MSEYEIPMDAPMGALPSDPQDADELAALYERYEAEGHLVRFGYVSDALDGVRDQEAPGWYAVCSCAAGSYHGPDGPAEDEEAILRTAEEVRWWHRSHRLEHGLEWQVFCPTGFLNRTAEAYRDEGHLVGVSELPDGTWVAICSCSREYIDDLEAVAERCSRQESSELAQAWADRHREIHALDPQDETIPAEYVLR